MIIMKLFAQYVWSIKKMINKYLWTDEHMTSCEMQEADKMFNQIMGEDDGSCRLQSIEKEDVAQGVKEAISESSK